MTDVLDVYFGQRLVGRLRADEVGRFCFVYAPAWLDGTDSFPISVSVHFRAEEYVGGSAHAFFANLLPEGAARQAVCNRLGISEGNDFALLRAIGGECAGALAIVESDRAPVEAVASDEQRYQELDDARLQELASGDLVPLLVGGPSTRLSLAGAQDKLPVAVRDGRVQLPLAGAPSTHILKLPNPRFAHLPVNEAFVLGFAARIGLEVVNAGLFTRTTPPSLLVERYDRRRMDEDGPIVRLHQEDLCQALGLPPTRKYEQEGGPTLANAIELVRKHVGQPLVDVPRLIQWQAFNIVAGNSDGHGKNLAILYEADQGIRLAPFYDLVCTRQYQRLDPSLAMGVGGRRKPDDIGRAQWLALSRELEIGARVVVDLVEAVVDRCASELDGWTEEFRDRYENPPILRTLPRRIRKHATRLQRGMR